MLYKKGQLQTFLVQQPCCICLKQNNGSAPLAVSINKSTGIIDTMYKIDN